MSSTGKSTAVISRRRTAWLSAQCTIEETEIRRSSGSVGRTGRGPPWPSGPCGPARACHRDPLSVQSSRRPALVLRPFGPQGVIPQHRNGSEKPVVVNRGLLHLPAPPDGRAATSGNAVVVAASEQPVVERARDPDRHGVVPGADVVGHVDHGMRGVEPARADRRTLHRAEPAGGRAEVEQRTGPVRLPSRVERRPVYSPDAGDLRADLGHVLPRAQGPDPGIQPGDAVVGPDLAGVVAESAVLGDHLQLAGVPALDRDRPSVELGDASRRRGPGVVRPARPSGRG